MRKCCRCLAFASAIYRSCAKHHFDTPALFRSSEVICSVLINILRSIPKLFVFAYLNKSQSCVLSPTLFILIQEVFFHFDSVCAAGPSSSSPESSIRLLLYRTIVPSTSAAYRSHDLGRIAFTRLRSHIVHSASVAYR